MRPAIHQLLPVLTAGDAIGGAVLATQRMLHRAGFRSEIFAEYVEARLSRRAHLVGEVDRWLQEDDALIYHLAIGSPVAGVFERTRAARRILVYHNITPAEHFRSTNQHIAFLLERGREELHRLAPLMDLCIGDSTFNVEELREAGARECEVVPPPVDLSRLNPQPSCPVTPPTVLFVGRLAPNKCQEDLIRALAALRATAIPDARLALVGINFGTEAYVSGLRELATQIGVGDDVDIPGGKSSDAAVSQYYKEASVFACASSHEGFCVPILEAMSFSLPVVAFAAGAVPETIGDAGLLLEHKDPLVWAAVLERLITDPSLRRALATAGRRRLESFSEAAIEERLLKSLATIGLVAEPAIPGG